MGDNSKIYQNRKRTLRILAACIQHRNLSMFQEVDVAGGLLQKRK